VNASKPSRLDRREAIKWMLTAAASVALLDRASFAADNDKSPASVHAAGYGTDPDFSKTYQPGELWPLTLTDAQRAAAAALCDMIIPADERGPSASSVHVPDFIDEWISAPYTGHDADRRTVVNGLGWLDAEAQKRFERGFVQLDEAQKSAICDDICSATHAAPEFRTAAQFFRKFRDLTAGGYYTTAEGMKDIGYVGNVPLVTFEGPPAEVLRKLGLA
jgi:hypothetical protein